MNDMNGYYYCNPYVNLYPTNYGSVMSYPVIQQADSFSIESDYGALCGQEHRSSADFTASGNYSISAPNGVEFSIKINKNLQKDDPVLKVGFRNGYSVYFTGEKYYIADPKGATNPFQVVFTPIVGPEREQYNY